MITKYATRTVLLDDNGRVTVINVQKYGYYKVPGGGVEDGEDLRESAKREVLEEAGCDCEIIAELGRTETDIPGWELHDVSDGFVARVVGEKKPPHFDDYEAERGFSLEWYDSLDAAITKIEANRVSEPDVVALQFRDLGYLKLAKKYLEAQV
ncbi:NUDIX domain-containing protein [Candidatus Saccharibacteria bacterium]|nr:NUDIX domain-containing protein [Candidatus Saccharibacteria bacterium]